MTMFTPLVNMYRRKLTTRQEAKHKATLADMRIEIVETLLVIVPRQEDMLDRHVRIDEAADAIVEIIDEHISAPFIRYPNNFIS